MRTLVEKLNRQRRKEQNLIHLQGVGEVLAKPAKDFKIGEKFMWNTGATSEIVAIIKETKAFIIFKTKTTKDFFGKDEIKYWERKLKKDRLVGIG